MLRLASKIGILPLNDVNLLASHFVEIEKVAQICLTGCLFDF